MSRTTEQVQEPVISRRQVCAAAVAALASAALPRFSLATEANRLQLKYIVGSSMYGALPLAEILPQVHQTGATAIDIWPRVHGNQREQMEQGGLEDSQQLLAKFNVSLGCLTRYDLGPFRLQDEMRYAQKFNCPTLVTGGKGPVGLTGKELKQAVAGFVEKMKPHLEVAAETSTTIAIENHANNLIDSPESLKWLAELRPSKHLAIALAPYHLPQDEKLLSQLIEDLGDSIAMFYAWEHGRGCKKKLPKEQELMQMPGRGTLDFAPLLAALRKIHYQGWTEIFMHPVPRGIPIFPTAKEVTAEINRARVYLEKLR